ncbi:MAG: DNA alkylation repair protein [Gemmatimonadota bacterium]|nr:MAG: DNA alkylation repair protein [Gemmatimonadota bacterium]
MARKIEHNARRLKRLLREAADPETREGQLRYVKGPLRSLGVKAADIHRTASAAAREYRGARLDLDQVIQIADRLWKPGILEERALAVLIVGKFKRHLERRHWDHFDAWVDSLSNWAETDGICGEILGPLLTKQPGLVKRLKPWTRSQLRWRRRAAAVALVHIARRGELHHVAFEICDRLAGDRDDMVEKAVGWLLKEISRTQPGAVADYLLDNIDGLSRTTVRYACEKLPAKLRARVMAA